MTAAVAAAKNNKILLKKNKEKQQDTDRCSICGKKLRFARTSETIVMLAMHDNQCRFLRTLVNGVVFCKA